MVTKVEAEVGDGIVVTAPTSLTNTDIDYGAVVRTVGEEVGRRKERIDWRDGESNVRQ